MPLIKHVMKLCLTMVCTPHHSIVQWPRHARVSHPRQVCDDPALIMVPHHWCCMVLHLGQHMMTRAHHACLVTLGEGQRAAPSRALATDEWIGSLSVLQGLLCTLGSLDLLDHVTNLHTTGEPRDSDQSHLAGKACITGSASSQVCLP
eukprot:1157585-Pelagomonas_calceolata.AAC.5